MENLYETLLGRPLPRQAPAQRQPFAWDAADGAGPDRLFNRYRRLRLDARSSGVTPLCPATPSAIPA